MESFQYEYILSTTVPLRQSGVTIRQEEANCWLGVWLLDDFPARLLFWKSLSFQKLVLLCIWTTTDLLKMTDLLTSALVIVVFSVVGTCGMERQNTTRNGKGKTSRAFHFSKSVFIHLWSLSLKVTLHDSMNGNCAYLAFIKSSCFPPLKLSKTFSHPSLHIETRDCSDLS